MTWSTDLSARIFREFPSGWGWFIILEPEKVSNRALLLWRIPTVLLFRDTLVMT